MVEFIEVYPRSLAFYAGAGDVSNGSVMGIFGGMWGEMGQSPRGVAEWAVMRPS
jgi:hypothetical protein